MPEPPNKVLPHKNSNDELPGKDITSDSLLSATIAGASFTFPAHWGEIIVRPDSEEEPTPTYVFADLHARNIYPIGDNKSIAIYTRPYDSGANRYEELCANPYECTEITKVDLLQEKADIAATGKVSAHGVPVLMKEFYYPPAAHLIRGYRFYTATHRVDVNVGYDLGDLYAKEYDDRNKNGENLSLSDLVAEDIGEEFTDPYNKLVALYPIGAKDLQEFMDAAEKMMMSVEVKK